MKFWNILGWFIYCVCFYSIFKIYVKLPQAIFAFLLLLFSTYFFLAKQMIGSDFMFLACLGGALLCFERFESSSQKGYFFAALVWMGLSIVMRTAGAVLFVSMFIYYIFVKRNYKCAVFLTVVCFFSMGFIEIFSHALTRYIGQKSVQSPVLLVHTFCSHLDYSFENITRFFVFTLPAGIFSSLLGRIIIWLLFISGSISIGIRFLKRNVTFYELFFIIYFISVSVWPYNEGIRLYLPLVGLCLLFFMRIWNAIIGHGHWQSILTKLPIALFAGLLMYNGYFTFITRNADYDVLFKSYNQELFHWVNQNLTSEQKYLFFKPRTLSLMSGRAGHILPEFPEKQKEILLYAKGLKSDFLICHRSRDALWIEYLNQQPRHNKIIWHNAEYVIYRVNIN